MGQLELAWEHRSGDFSDGSGDWGLTSFQVTPLVDDDTLYYCTPFGRVFALNAETGAERWQFDPRVQNRRSGVYPAVCRGVALWQASDPEEATASCGKRVLYGTRDAELIALDAATGLPCADFGNNGRVSLGLGARTRRLPGTASRQPRQCPLSHGQPQRLGTHRR